MLPGLRVYALLALSMLAAFLWPRSGYGEGGNSITSPDTAGTVGRYTSLMLDVGGNPVVSYYDYTNSDLKVMHCNDANCEGDDESITSPDSGGMVGYYTSLALDALGNPVVSYGSGHPDWELKILHCNDAICAGGDESITSPDTNLGQSFGHTSLVLDASGRPVVSYYDGNNRDLKVLHCNDPNCQGGDESITSPDTGGWVGAHTSLALDSSEHPVISYLDESNGDLKVMHCNDPDCTGGDESITSPDTGGWVGAHTSLALDSSGNPVVSYWDITNADLGDLKVLHCNDPDCTGGDESITSPDTGGDHTSLALDTNGYPVVSYYEAWPNEDLNVLHCNDADCSGGDESITSPDTSGDVGFYTSLAIDTSGNPVVSYHEWDDGDLKVLHCSDAGCSDKPTPTPTTTRTATRTEIPSTTPTPTLPPIGGAGVFPEAAGAGASEGNGAVPAAIIAAVMIAAAGLSSAGLLAWRRGTRTR